MKLGVFLVLFGDRPLEAALDEAASRGLDAVEIGAGDRSPHCRPDELLADEGKRAAFARAVESRGLSISALSCHANPLHPRAAVAGPAHETFVKTVRLAERLGVPVVNTFSGCPGDHEGAVHPNWPVAAWPDEFREILDWQWREKVIPYWAAQATFLAERGVTVGLELHGGFSVHSPATMLRLRRATGPAVGANLDPSHLWWQGIDPVAAVRLLGADGAIHHVHAKDTAIDPAHANAAGVLDMTPYADVANRAWQFRTVGYGHDLKTWADLMTALRLAGYDHAVSIEHEDGLMSVGEGLDKAVANLRPWVIRTRPGKLHWA